MPPLAIAAAVAGAGALGGAAISANAAGNAADTQANAALQAAQLQKQLGEENLGFQQNVFNTQQSELAPYLQSGYSSLANLDNLLGLSPQASVPNIPASSSAPMSFSNPSLSRTVAGGFGGERMSPSALAGARGVMQPTIQPRPVSRAPLPQKNLGSLVNPGLGSFGSLMQPFNEQFTAPTNVTEQNDPGYQFRLNQGLQALDRSAAAQGNLLSPAALKGEQQYAQDYASNEYGNVYNRAMQQYLNRFNIFNQNQSNQFNRLASLAGVGQTTAGQLAGLGSQQGSNVGNILLNLGSQMGQGINNAAAARASGYVGGANAVGGALSNTGNLISQYMMLQQLQNGGGMDLSGVNPGSGANSAYLQDLGGF